MKPVFGLADGNNFYVSCERVFNPYYRGKPTIILSNNGCAVRVWNPRSQPWLFPKS